MKKLFLLALAPAAAWFACSTASAETAHEAYMRNTCQFSSLKKCAEWRAQHTGETAPAAPVARLKIVEGRPVGGTNGFGTVKVKAYNKGTAASQPTSATCTFFDLQGNSIGLGYANFGAINPDAFGEVEVVAAISNSYPGSVSCEAAR